MALNKNETKISPETARSLSHAIQISGTAAAAAHDVSIGLTAIRPYSDRRSERLLVILRKLADQETKNPEGYAHNLAFIQKLALTAETRASWCENCGMDKADGRCEVCRATDTQVAR